MTKVFLLPGFGGSADQPLLVKLSERLAGGVERNPVAPLAGAVDQNPVATPFTRSLSKREPQVALRARAATRGSPFEKLRVNGAQQPVRFECHRLALTRAKLTPGLEPYVAELSSLVGESVPILIGRSFGGRVALRLAHERKVKALVLLGFPIRPPGKPRLLDEHLLSTVPCPTLIVQGSDDELGPLSVLEPLLAKNTTLNVLEGAEHSFGRHEKTAIEVTAQWLRAISGTARRSNRRPNG